MLLRRFVTLPHPIECSTITVLGLSFQVRNGDWAFPLGHDHRKISLIILVSTDTRLVLVWGPASRREIVLHADLMFLVARKSIQCLTKTIKNYGVLLSSTISTSQLHVLPRFHTWPINPIISRESHTPLKECQEFSSWRGLPA